MGALGVARRFGLNVPETIESADNHLLVFGRTHPSVVAGPNGVGVVESCRPLFGSLPEESLFFLRFRLSLCLLDGTRASEERESRLDSASNVWIASMQELFERSTSAW
jgi:hypothetical protein